MDFFTLMQTHAAVFLLLLTRVSGIFIISPFFGSMNIPIYFRAATAAIFAAVLFPVVDALGAIAAPPTVLMFTIAVLGELFVGWLIGFVAYIAFAAIQMAGKIMDMQVGFAIVNVLDPTSGQQMPLIGDYYFSGDERAPHDYRRPRGEFQDGTALDDNAESLPAVYH